MHSAAASSLCEISHPWPRAAEFCNTINYCSHGDGGNLDDRRLQEAYQEYIRVRLAAEAQVERLAHGDLVTDPLVMCPACAKVPTDEAVEATTGTRTVCLHCLVSETGSCARLCSPALHLQAV
jgi:hypothetical protein